MGTGTKRCGSEFENDYGTYEMFFKNVRSKNVLLVDIVTGSSVLKDRVTRFFLFKFLIKGMHL